VASLLKAWFRELPDDLFPKELQEELSAKHHQSDTAPDDLKIVISNFPPWRYYLLFAITCHLSLVAGYSDVNKMTPGNLYVCIGNSLKLDGNLFRWLVEDWRNCWIGCENEKAYLDDEYAWLEAMDKALQEQNEPSGRQQVFSNMTMRERVASPLGRPQAVRSASSDDSTRFRTSKGSRSIQDPEVGHLSLDQRGNDSERHDPTRNERPSTNPRANFAAGARKGSNAETTPRTLGEQRHMPRARSPLGRRRAESNKTNQSQERGEFTGRSQSQPRDERRDKSPAGRRRRQHTRTSQASPHRDGAGTGNSTGSDAGADPSTEQGRSTSAGGRRRRDDGGGVPDVPSLNGSQIPNLQPSIGSIGMSGNNNGNSNSSGFGPQTGRRPSDALASLALSDRERALRNVERPGHLHSDSQGSQSRLELNLPPPISPTYRSRSQIRGDREGQAVVGAGRTNAHASGRG